MGRFALLQGEQAPIQLSLQLDLSLPTGEADNYFSYSEVASHASLLAERAFRGRFGQLKLLGNAGYARLPRVELFGIPLEDELRAAAGLSWTKAREERWLIESSVQSRLGVGDAWLQPQQRAVEATLGGRFKMIEGITFGLYGSKGLTESAGLSSWSLSALLLISDPTASSARPSGPKISPCDADPWSRACIESLPPRERPSDTVQRRVIPVN